jgi:HD superfamily phosphohydrolase
VKPPKVVADPISGIINLRPVLPIVETREFQALAGKCQLGMTSLVFRAARHTRYEHCLGAYAATLVRARQWKQQGSITQEEADALAVYALIHDIGHPAFSHVTEDFLPLDDDEMTLEMIRGGKLRWAIADCDVNPALVESFADRSNPLYLGVHDKNLGTEKLDYLERDGFYTLLSRPVAIQYLREYVYFVDGAVAVDEKVVDHAADLQTFYMKMYKEVYLRKSLVIAQRMFHKAVYHLIRSGELEAAQLQPMVDAELIGLMYSSEDSVVRVLYQALRERRLFREVISIRPKGFVRETRVAGKYIHPLEVEREDMDRLTQLPMLQKDNYLGLETLEQEIAKIAKIPQHSVLVVPVFNPERFCPKDVQIYGSDGKLHSLKARRRAHYARLEETAASYAALRICVQEQHRRQLFWVVPEVHAFLQTLSA